MKRHRVVLLIGGNMGDRLLYLNQAVARLNEDFQLIKKSGIYETEAWGGNSTGNYLNQALLMHTEFTPDQVLKIIHDIEDGLDRKRDKRWGNRTMDIDIIYFDDLVLSTPLLQIPHPFLQERRFVLLPLVEIIPAYIHPILQVSQLELLAGIKDSSAVKKWSEGTNT